MSVADRMAILDHGVIRQVGTPVDLYDRPASAYVARLLGAPMMNLIPADGALLGAARPGAAQLGVRPEDLQVRPDPAGAAKIITVEPLGGYTVLTLSAAGQTLRAMLRGQPQFEAGQPVSLAASPERMHHFSGDGQRLAALA